ncbi:MAG: hypothetical protein RIR48_1789 [Bacteroidota bacterium]|jgi:hypothetical protein
MIVHEKPSRSMKNSGETVTNGHVIIYVMIFSALMFSSCSVLEKASSHGFESGYYTMKQAGKNDLPVYVQSSEVDKRVHEITQAGVDENLYLLIPQGIQDSICQIPATFSKQSLDIDITSVLFKVRPTNAGIPLQLTSDFNAAMYLGWRYDTYNVKSQATPLGQCDYRMINRGFDIGCFAGLGTTPVNPFFTSDKVDREYSAMILQYGIAAFLESSMASFGISLGADHMIGPDRRHWIYQNRPWVGFIIGIALN